MAKIYLFGSHTIYGIPGEIVEWLREYTRQGHEFILSDKKGADEAFHRALSSVGAHNVKIYSLGEVKSNKYDFPVKKFNTFFDEETHKVFVVAEDNDEEQYEVCSVDKEMDIAVNKDWRAFRDRQLVKDCDMAICLWDGETKNTLETIKLLNIYDKICHMVKTI
jgi:hypothetical protein